MTSALLSGSSRTNISSKSFTTSALLSNGVGSSLFAPTSPALNSATGTYFKNGNLVGVNLPAILGSPTGSTVLNLPPLPGQFAPSLPATSQVFVVQNGDAQVLGQGVAFTDRIVVRPLFNTVGDIFLATGSMVFTGAGTNCGIPQPTSIIFCTSNT